MSETTSETRTKSLREMQDEVEIVNRTAGWYDEYVSFGEWVALAHTELSEALEAWRRWELADATDNSLPPTGFDGPDGVRPPKPEGVGSEFADVLIRLLDGCARFRVDLEAEYERKLAYNRTRPYRHGGKRQ